jgi:hypothetical protein
MGRRVRQYQDDEQHQQGGQSRQSGTGFVAVQQLRKRRGSRRFDGDRQRRASRSRARSAVSVDHQTASGQLSAVHVRRTQLHLRRIGRRKRSLVGREFDSRTIRTMFHVRQRTARRIDGLYLHQLRTDRLSIQLLKHAKIRSKSIALETSPLALYYYPCLTVSVSISSLSVLSHLVFALSLSLSLFLCFSCFPSGSNRVQLRLRL